MRGIRLEQAGVHLAGRPVLSDLTCTLDEARIGIIGANGSGKSTLLRLMAGLIAPTSGRVSVEGIDPAQDRKAMLSALGILFQNPDHQILFPTVIEELAFGLTQQGKTKAEAQAMARAALAAEGRADWAEASTHRLSQGQRQYLCLMAVLLMEPRTILLDEPFAALDLPSTLRMRRRLQALPQQLITISHDPASVEGCDRVLWLDAGRIRADGPPAEVLPAFLFDMEARGLAEPDAALLP